VTETRIASYSDYVTKSREKSTSPDESRQSDCLVDFGPRRWELQRAVEMWSDACVAARVERDEARQRVATLEAALDKAKQRELTVLGWLQERDAWAKAWKRAAMINRKRWRFKARRLVDAHRWAKAWKAAAKLARHGWLAHILPGLPRAWHKRRRGFLKLLWWTR